MTSPIHVMHAVLSLDAGGLEHVVLHLIRQGRSLGQRVSVLCIERPGVLAPEAQALGATVHCVHKPAGFIPATIPAIQKTVQTESPDVIHSHQIGALLYTGAAAHRAGIRNVLHTEHGKHYDSSKRRRWVAWWAARRARAFFCVSNDILQAVKAHRIVPARKLAVIENGIDLSRSADPETVSRLRTSLDIPPTANVIGTVGRLAAVKAQDVLLRAFARIPARENPPHLLLVGGGPLETSLRQLAQTLGIAPRTHFAGYQPDPTPYLKMMNVFALTSSSEGMPLSILEAWAQNLPVIASRVGGLPEIIADGKTGILFESGNDVLLAKALVELLQNAPLRRSLGQSGRDYAAARFDVATMAANYHQQYLKLLSMDSNQLPFQAAPVALAATD